MSSRETLDRRVRWLELKVAALEKVVFARLKEEADQRIGQAEWDAAQAQFDER